MKVNKTIRVLGIATIAMATYSLAFNDVSLFARIGQRSNKVNVVSLDARNQKLVRGMVKIRKVEVDRPAFVVVHKPEDVQNVQGGTYCRPIGVSSLITSKRNNVSISVGGGFRSGRLNIMIHYDTNGNGRFDEGIDLTAQGSNATREVTISP